MTNLRSTIYTFLLLFVVVSIIPGCSPGGDEDTLTIYSGRSEPLAHSLVRQFEKKTGTSVAVKYGRDAQLLAALQEEGDQSPADVFWANTTGALSNAVGRDLLQTLPDSLLDRPERFTPSHGRWVPVTTRFRVLAYNSDRVDPDDLPDSVLDLPEETDLEGRIGWTPTYSSFQDFVTALRMIEGRETALDWLTGVSDLNPKSYKSNPPMIRALKAGEIDVALTNHYYILQLKHGGVEGEYEGDEEEEEEEHEEEEPDPEAPVQTYHFADGDPGNLALLTGAGVLSSSEQDKKARKFLRFLLSKQAQAFAAERVNEYPVVSGVTVPTYMTPVEKALKLSPSFEPGRLSEIQKALDLLREAGVL